MPAGGRIKRPGVQAKAVLRCGIVKAKRDVIRAGGNVSQTKQPPITNSPRYAGWITRIVNARITTLTSDGPIG